MYLARHGHLWHPSQLQTGQKYRARRQAMMDFDLHGDLAGIRLHAMSGPWPRRMSSQVRRDRIGYRSWVGVRGKKEEIRNPTEITREKRLRSELVIAGSHVRHMSIRSLGPGERGRYCASSCDRLNIADTMSGRPFDNDGQRKRKKRVPLNCSGELSLAADVHALTRIRMSPAQNEMRPGG